MRFEVPYLDSVRSSCDIIDKWNHLLRSIQSKELQITKEMIEECEKEIQHCKLLKTHEVTQIIKNAKELFKTIDELVEGGIDSFVKQRYFHLICKKAEYVMVDFS